jgi:2-methylcitrate dehydratase PrpD
MSALMAQHGFTASPRALEAPRGLVQVVSTKAAWHEITDELGQRFEISFNTYKPFACGIVIHPSIDACVQLRDQGVLPRAGRAHRAPRAFAGARADRQEGTGRRPAGQVQRLPRLCRRPDLRPRRRRTSSTTPIVTRDDVVALRRKVVATVDNAIDEASVDVTAVLADGQRVHVFVEHAIGSLANPMTDAQLEAKFRGMSDAVLGAARCSELIQSCWGVGAAPDLRTLVRLATPA